MSIVLDFLKRSNTTPSANPDVFTVDSTAAIKSSYVYKDIHLDLNTSSFYTTNRLDVKESGKEIHTITDEECILQSIRNILTTSPGEKLLNPSFGVNIEHLLFSPVTYDQSHFMAEVISKELTRQERRAQFKNVHVSGNPDDSSYTIFITAVIPSLSKRQINISGIITVNGVKIERIESNTIA